MPSDFPIERWKQVKQDAAADATWVDRCQEVDAKLATIRPQIVDFVKSYLDGAIKPSGWARNPDHSGSGCPNL
jgi:hypothetical protein